MENCLKTSLKVSVNNPELLKLNYLRIYFNKQAVPTSRDIEIRAISAQDTLDFKASDNVIVSGQTLVDETTIGAYARTITIANVDCYADLGPMQNVRSIRLLNTGIVEYFQFDVARLVLYAPIEAITYYGYGEGELKFSHPELLINCSLYQPTNKNNYYGNIEQFENNTVLSAISVKGNWYGSIESLGNCIKLATLRLVNSVATGEVNTLAAALASNGKTSNLSIFGPLDNCTDDGNPITAEYLASKGATDNKIIITFSGGSYSKTYA